MTQLPQTTGLGFKPEHFHAILAQPGAVGFLKCMPRITWAMGERRTRC